MPRGRLSEKHVQQVAINQLAAHYQARSDTQAVIAEKEVVVRAGTKLGRGRADGLLVSLRRDGTIYTAALEAKSSRTLLNISPWYDNERWMMHALVAGGLGILPAILAGWYAGGWLWTLVFSIVAFFAVGFAYLLLTKEHSRYKLIDVIQQVKRYPADEHWIALSADAYNLLGPQQETLRLYCQREGIGLLRINSADRVNYVERPQVRTSKRGVMFLECYARSETINRKLHAKAEESKNQADPFGDPLI